MCKDCEDNLSTIRWITISPPSTNDIVSDHFWSVPVRPRRSDGFRLWCGRNSPASCPRRPRPQNWWWRVFFVVNGFPLYPFVIRHNFSMKNFLLDALIEVVGNRTHEHTLCERWYFADGYQVWVLTWLEWDVFRCIFLYCLFNGRAFVNNLTVIWIWLLLLHHLPNIEESFFEPFDVEVFRQRKGRHRFGLAHSGNVFYGKD